MGPDELAGNAPPDAGTVGRVKRPATKRAAFAARPMPPGELFDATGPAFAPSADLDEWVRHVLISEEGILHNPDHLHLKVASIGWVWTRVDSIRAGRFLLGQCEKMPPAVMGKWAKERALMQIEDWFGEVPDFLITLHGTAASTMEDASFLALVEHEMYHAAQMKDEWGAPKFNHMGNPIWTIRGHDVEEFVGVVRRYGAAATQVEELVAAAGRRPSVAPADISWACGTCRRLAA